MSHHISLLALAHAAVCAVLCFSLLNYQRDGARYRRWASLLSYVMIVASGGVVIRVFTGSYAEIDLAEFVLNAALCAGVVAMRGNVSRLLKPFGIRAEDKDEHPS